MSRSARDPETGYNAASSKIFKEEYYPPFMGRPPFINATTIMKDDRLWNHIKKKDGSEFSESNPDAIFTDHRNEFSRIFRWNQTNKQHYVEELSHKLLNYFFPPGYDAPHQDDRVDAYNTPVGKGVEVTEYIKRRGKKGKEQIVEDDWTPQKYRNAYFETNSGGSRKRKKSSCKRRSKRRRRSMRTRK